MSNLADTTLERALLAGIMVAPITLKRLLAEDGLRSEHFAGKRNAQAFDAIVRIGDRDAFIDELTLIRELGPGSNEFVHALFSDEIDHADFRNVHEYAEQIKSLARRRELQRAAALLDTAARNDDATALAQAEALLTTPADLQRTSWTAHERGEKTTDRLQRPPTPAWAWPFRELNKWTGGGVRRKQVVLLGGHSGIGKSTLFDQFLEHWGKRGLSVNAYLTEMTEEERTDRALARLSDIPFIDIASGNLNPVQKTQLIGKLTGLNFGVTECEGWTAAEIARHIKWNRWDIAGLDVLHEIPHRDERDLAEIAQTLRIAAKQANCVLFACVHLNDNRVTSEKRPFPVMRDVRGSGMLVRGADIVMFIHREDNDAGIPTMDGYLSVPKVRQGKPNGMKMKFKPEDMQFVPVVGE